MEFAMARVVQKRVRGTPYIQVVEDYKDGGVWRQKVLQSFGAANPRAHLEAVQCSAAVNAFKEQAQRRRGTDQWKPWVTAASIILGGAALTWLLANLVTEK